MKTNQIPGFAWPLPSGSNDLSSNQYHALKVDANGLAAAVAGATDTVVGFQTNQPVATNEAAAIESDGIVLAAYGAAVTAGSKVTVMANGKVENINGANTVVGIALATGILGDIKSIKLI